MNVAKLFAIYPGWMGSHHDSDSHYISAPQLARLYRVSMAHCVVVNLDDHAKPWRRERVAYAATLIPLRPRYNGDYSLPPISNPCEGEHGSEVFTLSK